MSKKQLNKRIEEAIKILEALDLPEQQCNRRSALTLLALLDLRPQQSWNKLKRPLMGVSPMMEWMNMHYQVSYTPNTRETIRRQTLHQFVAAGICQLNPATQSRGK